jgi:hypothetical protein
MTTKLIFTLSSAIILLIVIVLPEGLQAAAVYDCRDQNGSIVLSDTPLGKGYKCKPMESFKEITDEDRKTWEKEKQQKAKEWEAEQQRREKERSKIVEDQNREKEVKTQNESVGQEQIKPRIEVQRPRRGQ